MVSETAEATLTTVREFIAAAGVEHQDTRRRLLHDDFVVHEAGGLPFSGDYHGSRGFFELLDKINDVLKLTASPITVDLIGDNAAAARFQLTFTSRASGRGVQMKLVEIYTVRDGQIAELDVYYKDPAAVAALLTT